MKTFTQDANPTGAALTITDTAEMVSDGKGGTTPAVTSWRGPLEQIEKHEQTFASHGMSRGDASAMKDRIHEAKKQRDS